MAVSKRTRYEVLKRDNHTCRYCRSTENALTIDHVVPVALGGTDDPTNLVAACKDCNAGKSSTSPDAPLVEDVKNDTIRWAAAMEMAARRAMKRHEEAVDYVHDWTLSWNKYDIGYQSLPAGWEESIDGFRRAGLTIEQLQLALAISMSKRHVALREKFRYMCGVAWSMVTEMQAEAKAILQAQEASDGA